MPKNLRLSPVLVTLACALTIFIAGCGGGGSGGDTASFIPRDAFVVSEFSLDFSRDGEWKDAERVAKRVPAWTFVEGEIPSAQAIIEQGLGEDTKVSYKEDIEPWLGSDGGVAAWVPDSKKKVSERFDDITGIVWVEVTDQDEALAFMRKANGKPKTSEVEGTTVYESGKDADIDMGFYTVVDDALIGADKKADLGEALKARDGESFADDHDLDALFDRDGRNALSATVVDGEKLYGFAKEAVAEEGDKRFEKIINDKAIERFFPDTVAFYVGTDNTGAWIDVLRSHEDDFTGPRTARKLAEQAPETTAVIEAHNAAPYEEVGELWQLIDENIELDPAECDDMKKFCSVGLDLARLVFGDEYTKLAEEAYTEEIVFGTLLHDDGMPGSYYQLGVQDADKVQELSEKPLPKYQELAGLFKATITREEGDDGLNLWKFAYPKNSEVAKAVQELAKTPGTGLTGSPLLENPIVMYEQIDDEHQIVALDKDDLDAAQEALDGGDTLADNKTYKRDVEAADPPNDATTYGWFDTKRYLETVLKSLGDKEVAQYAGIAGIQLEHVGGPLYWSTTEDVGDDQFARFTLEIPLYK